MISQLELKQFFKYECSYYERNTAGVVKFSGIFSPCVQFSELTLEFVRTKLDLIILELLYR